MEYLDFILEKEESKNLKEKYEEFKHLFEDVKEFIIKKKRILYGGTALNEMLSKNKKFYKETQLPDYDVFTPTPKKDSLELARFLKKRGYNYIEIKPGFWHKGTFKVFAEFQPLVDFTFVRRKFYNFLLEQEKKNPHQNQSDPKLLNVPPLLLLYSFYKELSRPKGSLYRLKKVFSRFKIFQKEFGLETSPVEFSLEKIDPELMPYLEIVRSYVKERQIAFVGGFAIGLQLGANRRNSINCCSVPSIPMFDILSANMKETLKDLKEKIPNLMVQGVDPTSLNEIMPRQYLLKTSEGKTFARILNVNDGCFSTDEICGYKIGNLDTILSFLYSQLINDIFFEKKVNDVPAKKYTEKMIEILEKENAKLTLKERFHLKCWGKEKTREDIFKEKWKNKKRIKISFY